MSCPHGDRSTCLICPPSFGQQMIGHTPSRLEQAIDMVLGAALWIAFCVMILTGTAPWQ